MSPPFELNPAFSFTLLGSCAIYATTRPTWRAWTAVCVIAVALRMAITRAMGGLGSYYGVGWITWGAFAGIASILALSAQMIRARVHHDEVRRKVLRETFYSATVFPLFSLLIGYALPPITWLRPNTLDLLLLKFDGSLGFQPSFILGRWLYPTPNWWGVTTIFYYALPLGASVLYSLHLADRRTGQPTPVRILELLLSLMTAGFALYAVFPATGPAHAFPSLYPWKTPSLPQIFTLVPNFDAAPRNCMPSLHLAGALAVFWNSRRWPGWGRILAALYLLITAFATLALGEHYLVDLVVAVPFTLFFQAAWTSVHSGSTYRHLALISGATLTAAWLVALRYALPLFMLSPSVSWSAIILTLGWCSAAKIKVDKASGA